MPNIKYNPLDSLYDAPPEVPIGVSESGINLYNTRSSQLSGILGTDIIPQSTRSTPLYPYEKTFADTLTDIPKQVFKGAFIDTLSGLSGALDMTKNFLEISGRRLLYAETKDVASQKAKNHIDFLDNMFTSVREGMQFLEENIETDPESWINMLSRGVGSVAAAYAGGGAGLLASRSKLALTLLGTKAKYIPMASVALADAVREAGSTYNTVMDKYGDLNKATDAGLSSLALNSVLNYALMRYIPTMNLMSPEATKFKSGIKQILKYGIGATGEAFQESAQQVISNLLTDEDMWSGVKESAILGGVLGGIFDVGGDIYARHKKSISTETKVMLAQQARENYRTRMGLADTGMSMGIPLFDFEKTPQRYYDTRLLNNTPEEDFIPVNTYGENVAVASSVPNRYWVKSDFQKMLDHPEESPQGDGLVKIRPREDDDYALRAYTDLPFLRHDVYHKVLDVTDKGVLLWNTQTLETINKMMNGKGIVDDKLYNFYRTKKTVEGKLAQYMFGDLKERIDKKLPSRELTPQEIIEPTFYPLTKEEKEKPDTSYFYNQIKQISKEADNYVKEKYPESVIFIPFKIKPTKGTKLGMFMGIPIPEGFSEKIWGKEKLDDLKVNLVSIQEDFEVTYQDIDTLVKRKIPQDILITNLGDLLKHLRSHNEASIEFISHRENLNEEQISELQNYVDKETQKLQERILELAKTLPIVKSEEKLAEKASVKAEEVLDLGETAEAQSIKDVPLEEIAEEEIEEVTEEEVPEGTIPKEKAKPAQLPTIEEDIKRKIELARKSQEADRIEKVKKVFPVEKKGEKVIIPKEIEAEYRSKLAKLESDIYTKVVAIERKLRGATSFNELKKFIETVITLKPEDLNTYITDKDLLLVAEKAKRENLITWGQGIVTRYEAAETTEKKESVINQLRGKYIRSGYKFDKVDPRFERNIYATWSEWAKTSPVAAKFVSLLDKIRPTKIEVKQPTVTTVPLTEQNKQENVVAKQLETKLGRSPTLEEIQTEFDKQTKIVTVYRGVGFKEGGMGVATEGYGIYAAPSFKQAAMYGSEGGVIKLKYKQEKVFELKDEEFYDLSKTLDISKTQNEEIIKAFNEVKDTLKPGEDEAPNNAETISEILTINLLKQGYDTIKVIKEKGEYHLVIIDPSKIVEGKELLKPRAIPEKLGAYLISKEKKVMEFPTAKEQVSPTPSPKKVAWDTLNKKLLRKPTKKEWYEYTKAEDPDKVIDYILKKEESAETELGSIDRETNRRIANAEYSLDRALSMEEKSKIRQNVETIYTKAKSKLQEFRTEAKKIVAEKAGEIKPPKKGVTPLLSENVSETAIAIAKKTGDLHQSLYFDASAKLHDITKGIPKNYREVVPYLIEIDEIGKENTIKALNKINRPDLVTLVNNTPESIGKMVAGIKDAYLQAYVQLKESGTDVDERGYYVNRIWEEGSGSIFKARRYATLFDGIMSGKIPATTDINVLMDQYNKYQARHIARKAFADAESGWLSTVASSEGFPLVVRRGDMAPIRSGEVSTYYEKISLPLLNAAIGWKTDASAWVHPELWNTVHALFSQPTKGNKGDPIGLTADALRTLNEVAKQMLLTGSLFHAGALTEVGFGAGISNKLGIIFNPINVYDTLVNGKHPIFDNPEMREMARDQIKHGFMLNVTPDLNISQRNKIKEITKYLTKNIPGAGVVEQVISVLTDTTNNFMFGHTLNLVKMFSWQKNVNDEIKRFIETNNRAPNEKETSTIKYTVSNVANNFAGGQNWLHRMLEKTYLQKGLEFVSRQKLDPVKLKQIMDTVWFANDWTTSVIRHATMIPEGAYESYFGKTEEAKYEGRIKLRLASWFWARSFYWMFLLSQLAQYLITGKFTWDNEPDKKTVIAYGKDENGRVKYFYPGKQYREIYHWLPIIGDPLKLATGKLSIGIREIISQVSGTNPYWKDESFKNEGVWESIPDRMLSIAESFKPIVLSESGSWTGMPVKKGKTIQGLIKQKEAIERDYALEKNRYLRENVNKLSKEKLLGKLRDMLEDKNNKIKDLHIEEYVEWKKKQGA